MYSVKSMVAVVFQPLLLKAFAAAAHAMFVLDNTGEDQPVPLTAVLPGVGQEDAPVKSRRKIVCASASVEKTPTLRNESNNRNCFTCLNLGFENVLISIFGF